MTAEIKANKVVDVSQEKEWQTTMIPHGSKKVSQWWASAEAAALGEGCWEKHFISSGYVALATITSCSEIFSYAAQGAAFFCSHIFHSFDLKQAFIDLGADLFAMLQSFALTVVGVALLAVGFFFPQQVYSLINPTRTSSNHSTFHAEWAPTPPTPTDLDDLRAQLSIEHTRELAELRTSTQTQIEELTRERDARLTPASVQTMRESLEGQIQKLQAASTATQAEKNEIETQKNLLEGERTRLNAELTQAQSNAQEAQNRLADATAQLQERNQRIQELLNSYGGRPPVDPAHLATLHAQIVRNEELIAGLKVQLTSKEGQLNQLQKDYEQQLSLKTRSIEDMTKELETLKAQSEREKVEAEKALSDHSHHIAGLNDQLTELDRGYQNLQKGLLAKETELAELQGRYDQTRASHQSEVDALNLRIGTLSDEITAQTGTSAQLSEEIEPLKIQIADKSRELKESQQQLQEAGAALIQLQAQIDAATDPAAIAVLTQEQNASQERIKTLEAEQNALQDSLKESQTQIQQKEQALLELNRTITGLNHEKETVQTELQEKEAEVSRLRGEHQKALDEKEALSLQCTQAQAEIAQLRAAHAAKELEKDQLTQRLTDLTESHAKALVNLEGQLKASQVELEQLRAQLGETQTKQNEELARLTQELNASKTAFQELEQEKIQSQRTNALYQQFAEVNQHLKNIQELPAEPASDYCDRLRALQQQLILALDPLFSPLQDGATIMTGAKLTAVKAELEAIKGRFTHLLASEKPIDQEDRDYFKSVSELLEQYIHIYQSSQKLFNSNVNSSAFADRVIEQMNAAVHQFTRAFDAFETRETLRNQLEDPFVVLGDDKLKKENERLNAEHRPLAKEELEALLKQLSSLEARIGKLRCTIDSEELSVCLRHASEYFTDENNSHTQKEADACRLYIERKLAALETAAALTDSESSVEIDESFSHGDGLPHSLNIGSRAVEKASKGSFSLDIETKRLNELRTFFEASLKESSIKDWQLIDIYSVNPLSVKEQLLNCEFVHGDTSFEHLSTFLLGQNKKLMRDLYGSLLTLEEALSQGLIQDLKELTSTRYNLQALKILLNELQIKLEKAEKGDHNALQGHLEQTFRIGNGDRVKCWIDLSDSQGVFLKQFEALKLFVNDITSKVKKIAPMAAEGTITKIAQLLLDAEQSSGGKGRVKTALSAMTPDEHGFTELIVDDLEEELGLKKVEEATPLESDWGLMSDLEKSIVSITREPLHKKAMAIVCEYNDPAKVNKYRDWLNDIVNNYFKALFCDRFEEVLGQLEKSVTEKQKEALIKRLNLLCDSEFIRNGEEWRQWDDFYRNRRDSYIAGQLDALPELKKLIKNFRLGDKKTINGNFTFINNEINQLVGKGELIEGARNLLINLTQPVTQDARKQYEEFVVDLDELLQSEAYQEALKDEGKLNSFELEALRVIDTLSHLRWFEVEMLSHEIATVDYIVGQSLAKGNKARVNLANKTLEAFPKQLDAANRLIKAAPSVNKKSGLARGVQKFTGATGFGSIPMRMNLPFKRHTVTFTDKNGQPKIFHVGRHSRVTVGGSPLRCLARMGAVGVANTLDTIKNGLRAWLYPGVANTFEKVSEPVKEMINLDTGEKVAADYEAAIRAAKKKGKGVFNTNHQVRVIDINSVEVEGWSVKREEELQDKYENFFLMSQSFHPSLYDFKCDHFGSLYEKLRLHFGLNENQPLPDEQRLCSLPKILKEEIKAAEFSAQPHQYHAFFHDLFQFVYSEFFKRPGDPEAFESCALGERTLEDQQAFMLIFYSYQWLDMLPRLQALTPYDIERGCDHCKDGLDRAGAKYVVKDIVEMSTMLQQKVQENLKSAAPKAFDVLLREVFSQSALDESFYSLLAPPFMTKKQEVNSRIVPANRAIEIIGQTIHRKQDGIKMPEGIGFSMEGWKISERHFARRSDQSSHPSARSARTIEELKVAFKERAKGLDDEAVGLKSFDSDALDKLEQPWLNDLPGMFHQIDRDIVGMMIYNINGKEFKYYQKYILPLVRIANSLDSCQKGGDFYNRYMNAQEQLGKYVQEKKLEALEHTLKTCYQEPEGFSLAKEIGELKGLLKELTAHPLSNQNDPILAKASRRVSAIKDALPKPSEILKRHLGNQPHFSEMEPAEKEIMVHRIMSYLHQGTAGKVAEEIHPLMRNVGLNYGFIHKAVPSLFAVDFKDDGSIEIEESSKQDFGNADAVLKLAECNLMMNVRYTPVAEGWHKEGSCHYIVERVLDELAPLDGKQSSR